jgi:hypothetical protein
MPPPSPPPKVSIKKGSHDRTRSPFQREQKERAMHRKMVKISVEVHSGTACFRVSVQAASIRKALSVVGARYQASEVRMIFPIAPECFFVDGPALEGMVETEHQKELAA